MSAFQVLPGPLRWSGRGCDISRCNGHSRRHNLRRGGRCGRRLLPSSARLRPYTDDYMPVSSSDLQSTFLRQPRCSITQKGLMVIIPLSAAAWACTLVAVSEMNIGMYSVCVALNIVLACAIFFFHALSNPEVTMQSLNRSLATSDTFSFAGPVHVPHAVPESQAFPMPP